MGVIIEIITSAVVFGILLLAIMFIVINLNEVTFEKTYALNMETNIVTLARLIEHDFVKIGYRSAKPSIIKAEPNAITFTSDLENNGIIRVVKYYLGSALDTVVSETKNPHDKILYREVTGYSTMNINMGLVEFNLTYMDSAGKVTMNPALVKSIRVKVRLENPDPIYQVNKPAPDNVQYPGVFWEKTIYPRNL